MVEALSRTLVLDEARAAKGAYARATLRALPPTAQWSFRGQGAALQAAGSAFGVTLPQAPCRSARNAGRSALWLGPDEWLLMAPELERASIIMSMGAALETIPHALVSVGHRNVMLEIEGPDAALVINGGCPLDLDQASFPIGMCTRTILAKAQIVLWRLDQEQFGIIAWRSFAPYVWDLLVEARARL